MLNREKCFSLKLKGFPPQVGPSPEVLWHTANTLFFVHLLLNSLFLALTFCVFKVKSNILATALLLAASATAVSNQTVQ